jgi:hypothetical protein
MLGTTVTSVSRWETGQRSIAEPIARFVRLVLALEGGDLGVQSAPYSSAALPEYPPTRGTHPVERRRNRGQGAPGRVQAGRPLLSTERTRRRTDLEMERDRIEDRGRAGRERRTQRRPPPKRSE